MATNSSLQYTDDQLRAAALQAGKCDSVDIIINDAIYVTDSEIEDLRRILSHLPEPDWLLKLQGLTTDQETINERLEQSTELEAAQVPSNVFRTLIRMALSGKIFIDDLRVFASHGIQLDDEARQEIATFWDKRHALPDQQDDWQECAFEEIRKGDRVKKVLVTESGQIHTTEGVANYYLVAGDLRWWFTEKASWKDSGVDQYIARSDEPHGGPVQVTLYRIPAPVTHPDPEVCEHIIVYETTRQKYGPQNREYPSFHYSWDDDLWRGDISRVLESWEILEWDYAKVVIADE